MPKLSLHLPAEIGLVLVRGPNVDSSTKCPAPAWNLLRSHGKTYLGSHGPSPTSSGPHVPGRIDSSPPSDNAPAGDVSPKRRREDDEHGDTQREAGRRRETPTGY